MHRKSFILHASREGRFLWSERFPSRTALAAWLRGQGIHFSNSSLSGIGQDSLQLSDGRGMDYEIEESATDDGGMSEIVVDGQTYISISEFCRRTGSPRSSVYRLASLRQIPCIFLGRMNRVYVYWGS